MLQSICASKASKAKNKKGFTLIELSIVLVIAGLIVSAVFVGRELVQAANIRNIVSAAENYRMSVHTFTGKYGYLPGDITPEKAAAYGFAARAGTLGSGDGNGLVETCGTIDPETTEATAKEYAGCENLLFWRDLSDAKLIKETLNTATDAMATSLSADELPLYYPLVKAANSYAMASGKRLPCTFTEGQPNIAGKNFIAMVGISETNSNGVQQQIMSISPAEAFPIDAKMDDGKPLSGQTISITSANQGFCNWSTPPGQDLCYFYLGEIRYNTSERYINSKNCKLVFLL